LIVLINRKKSNKKEIKKKSTNLPKLAISCIALKGRFWGMANANVNQIKEISTSLWNNAAYFKMKNKMKKSKKGRQNGMEI
jgi:hypothetical protein